VNNSYDTINKIRSHCNNDKNRVFAFGVGSGADRHLVDGCANAGKGKSYFVTENNLSALKGMVIDALLEAMPEPMLTGCDFSFG